MSAGRPWEGRRLHFIGVGGAGISGYARAAHEMGAVVTGSDRGRSPYAERLRGDGVLDARIGHDAANVPSDAGVEVVYSSAIGADNPERVQARRLGLRERSRADLLAEMTSLKRTIAVAGSHGKTTTSSMLACALQGAGLAPGWLVGGTVGNGLPNARWGAGEWLVVEADESDRSMLDLHVEIAVLTSAELDHPDAFGSLQELREAFRVFLAGPPQAVVWDRPDLLALRQGPVVAYDVSEPLLQGTGSRFRWRQRDVRLTVPGAHNALNAAAALEAARLAGADEARAVAALEDFSGAGRRFQLLGATPAGAVVYDDYAHHPTEVAATLQAARLLLDGGGRLVAVFQPHLFSRTAALADGFGRALAIADVAVVLDVFAARERAVDHPGVSGLTLAAQAADAAHGRPVLWLPSFEQAEPVLRAMLGPHDVCVVMGAGDVDELGRRLVAPAAHAHAHASATSPRGASGDATVGSGGAPPGAAGIAVAAADQGQT
jgi:UDP-N-acetylmuramate--alanine ligase